MPSLKFFCFITLFTLISSIQAQYLETSRIRGNIINHTNKETLKKGSQFKKTDDIRFLKNSDRIAAFDKKTGQLYIVYPTSNDLLPTYYTVQGRVKGRPGAITNSISLINHINEKQNYLVIGDACTIKMSASAFPMNADTFFYISYAYEEEIINKKLSFKGDSLIIDKLNLFSADFDKGEKYGVDTTIQIAPSAIKHFEFRYFDAANHQHITFYDPSQPDDLQHRLFIPIQLKFLDTKQLKEEVRFLIDNFKEKDSGIAEYQLDEKIHAVLEGIYAGKIEASNLRNWLEASGVYTCRK